MLEVATNPEFIEYKKYKANILTNETKIKLIIG